MSSYHGIELSESFFDTDRAARVLNYYFTSKTDKGLRYTGGAWDTFDPSGDRYATPHHFTTADLASCSLLSTAIGGRATLQLLTEPPPQIGELLHAIDPDADFADIDINGPMMRSVRELYAALCELDGIGPTRCTKLMARKRPRLVPIVDSVLAQSVYGGKAPHWDRLHTAMNAEDQRLWKFLGEAHTAAHLSQTITPLRVFDVLAWMDGTKQSQYARDSPRTI